MYKNIVRRGFGYFGLQISRSTQVSPLLHHKIEILFDVGANTGQYVRNARSQKYKGKVVSFEPLPDAHKKLVQNSKKDPLWIVHKRCAVGSKFTESVINVAKNSYSSSILPMLQMHSESAPDSIYVGSAKTNLIPLDSIFNLYRKNNERVYLKIDTQGFESEVLAGLAENLVNVFAVELELSITPLYAGQNLFMYFFNFFEEKGFILWSLSPGFFNQASGQLLQFDAVFVRPE